MTRLAAELIVVPAVDPSGNNGTAIPLFIESLPSGNLPLKSGNLKVASPMYGSGPLYVFPNTENNSGYALINTSAPSHNKYPLGKAVPANGIIEPIGTVATLAKNVVLVIFFNPLPTPIPTLLINISSLTKDSYTCSFDAITSELSAVINVAGSPAPLKLIVLLVTSPAAI